jgi:hypothetical protein
MSTEPTVSTGAETQNPAPATETPEVVTQETATEAEHDDSTTEEGGDEADKALKRMQRRIDKRTADVYRTKAENEQLRLRLAELEAKSGSSEETQDRSNADPVALAKEISRVERFNETANKLVAEGTKKHTDYRGALETLAAEVGPFVTQKGLPSLFMEAVLEVSDKPAELLYHLGKNPELAEELADLSPMKLAKRLDRIEREMSESSKPKASSAPKPLQEVRGAASGSRALADLEDKDFVKRRREQIANRR